MKDQEFSSPGKEFAPPRDEFARPRAEFAPPGREYARTGREFDQTAAPVTKSKKRRISPLMLTAAAVTTAVVAVSGLGLDNDPKLLLSTEERAVMDAITVALKQGDIDQLVLLTEDPVICKLVTETLTSFFEKESPENYHTQTESNIEAAGGERNYVSTHFSYDGRYIGPFFREDLDYYHTDYSTFLPNGSDAPINTTVRFSVDEHPNYHDESPYQGYDFFLYRDRDGTLSSWDYADTIMQDLYLGKDPEGTNHYQVVTVEGTKYYWNNHSSIPSLQVTEGSCTHVPQDRPDDSFYGFINYETFLENGTVSTYHDNGGEWVLDNVIEVRDGYSYVDGIKDETSYHEYCF